MTFLIDVGNSRLKICRYDPKARVASGVASQLPFDDMMAIRLEDIEHALPAYLASHPRSQAWGVSVARSALNEHVSALFKHACGSEQSLTWVYPSDHPIGVQNDYANPAQLGADRWAAALGLSARFKHRASEHYPDLEGVSAVSVKAVKAVILANFGTATTVDTVQINAGTEPDRFLGGLILPGVDMMFESLSRQTARLPLAQGMATDYPTDSDTAIVSGVMAAQFGALKQQIAVAHAHALSPMTVCVSGGAWARVQRAWDRYIPHEPFVHLPDIVLEGLAAYVDLAVSSYAKS